MCHLTLSVDNDALEGRIMMWKAPDELVQQQQAAGFSGLPEPLQVL